MYNYCLKRSVDLYLVFRQALEIGDARPCVTRNIFRSHLIVPTIDRLVFSVLFCAFSVLFFFSFLYEIERHLLKLSNADRFDGAAGSTLSQPSLFEVVDVWCSLVLVWCRLHS